MDKNKIKLAKIIFSDRSYCYVKTDKLDIKIGSITKIFSKNGEIIKRNSNNINWNNKKVTIEYGSNKIYKGKINKYGKLENGKIIEIIKGNYNYNKPNGRYKITFINRKIDINRTIEGRFKNGKPEGYCEITFGENDIFSGYNLYDEFTPNILNKIPSKKWQLIGKGKYIGKSTTIISEGYFEKGKLKDKILIEITKDDYQNRIYKINSITIDNTAEDKVFLDIDENKFVLLIKDYTFELKNIEGKFNGIVEIVLFNRDKDLIHNIDYYFRDGVLREENKKITKIIKGNYNKGKINGECKITYFNEKLNINRTIEGFFKNRKPKKKYKIIFGKGDSFESSIFEGKIEPDILNKIYRKEWYLTGEGRFTVFVGEGRKALFTQVYNKKGILKNVEYFFEEDESNKIIVDYGKINIALNRNEINNFEDLKKYIKICNRNNVILKDQDYCNSNLIKKCATYQMRTRLKGKNGELDDESRMGGGRTGLQSIIILAELVDDIDALKKVRFEVGQDNSCWPTNNYKDKNSFLKYLGITANNSLKNHKLTPIDTLLKNGISYISINMITTTRDHEVSSIIDLEKIKQGKENFIYTYDTARSIDNIDKDGDLGGLQNNCQIFSHIQQRLGSCWYHAACSTITTAKYPEIFEKIKKNRIKPIKKPRIEENRPNRFETLQILMMQKVAENLKVGRLGKILDEKGNRPKMVHQIVNQDFIGIVKNVLKI